MKIDRLMGILTILLQQETITAPELARRFEVSRRTIGRDIADLCKAGIPLATTQGYGGGISIAEGYKIDKTLLSGEELQALLIGLRGVDSVSKIPRLEAVAEKLSSRVNRAAADGLIVIDLASHYQTPLREKIDCIGKAAQDRRLITFTYFYEKGECQRTVEPYRLMFQWSSWYLLGYCLTRGAFRLFKLNRLWNLHTLPETFTARNVPAQALKLNHRLEQGSIRLRALFSHSAKYRFIEEYGTECYTETASHKLLFERDFASYENMRQWILSFGAQVQVLEPVTLREDIRRQAARLLKIYQGEQDI